MTRRACHATSPPRMTYEGLTYVGLQVETVFIPPVLALQHRLTNLIRVDVRDHLSPQRKRFLMRRKAPIERRDPHLVRGFPIL